MLSYVTTSLLDSDAQTVVNTVNTVGVMGKGLAAAFKKRHPEMFQRYRELCKARRFEVGQLWLWKGPNQWVLNFPTKKHWRHPSKLSYIEAGLEKFKDHYESRGIYEISFPRLGCGNGGLDWEVVKPLMERYLAPLPIHIYIHDFTKDIGLPEHYEGRPHPSAPSSFEAFLSHLHALIEERSGVFHTVGNGRAFHAEVLEDGSLRLERGGNGANKTAQIPREELFETWNMLLHGPLTRQQLAGRSHEEAYYFLPLMATLPFVRPLQLRRSDTGRQIGIELVRSGESRSPADQGPTLWA